MKKFARAILTKGKSFGPPQPNTHIHYLFSSSKQQQKNLNRYPIFPMQTRIRESTLSLLSPQLKYMYSEYIDMPKWKLQKPKTPVF